MDIWSFSTTHRGILYKLSFEASKHHGDTVEFVIRVVEDQEDWGVSYMLMFLNVA